MSCVPITPDMRYLLDVLRSWPISAEMLAQVKATPEWEEARAWGWVMASGELTGFGAGHAWELPQGIVPNRHGSRPTPRPGCSVQSTETSFSMMMFKPSSG